MKRAHYVSIVAVALMSFGSTIAVADNVSLNLEYNTNSLTWELYGEVTTVAGVDGSNGLSAVRAMIDDIDFGTLGDAVNIAPGIGAIFPNGNQPVLQTAGGTLDIIYGQDISDAPSVVGGVGVGGPSLIADGTFASAGTPPSFGDDDGGLTSEGLFLNVAAPGPFGGALDPDANILIETDVTPGGDPADLNMDGFVDGLDLGVLLGNWDQNGIPPSGGELNMMDPVDGLDLGILLGAWNPAPLGAVSAVPEPTSIASLACAILSLLTVRRKRS